MSVTDEDAASSELLPLVVDAGVRLAAFERVRPSLEDVFLRLVGRDADDAPAAGGRVLLRKELLESWRTLRLRSSAGCSCWSGCRRRCSPGYLPEIIEAAAGDQLPPIPIPTPVPADAADQLWKNLAQFGAFAAIVLAMGAVAGELDRGTAAFVLSKTATRGAFLGAKVAAIGLVLGALRRAGRRRRLGLHRDPVRAAAGRRLARLRGCSRGSASAPGRR